MKNTVKRLASLFTVLFLLLAIGPVSIQAESVSSGTEGENELEKTSYPTIDKKIINSQGELVSADSVKPGETVQFILTSNLPDNLFNYVLGWYESNGKTIAEGSYELTFHDDMCDTFTLIENSLIIRIGQNLLTADDYSFDVVNDCDQEERRCDFRITLDLIDLFNKGLIDERNVNNTEPIVVEYQAVLSEEATAGAHPNHAWITSREEEVFESMAFAEVYELQVIKIDHDDKSLRLAGAEFVLKNGTDSDAEVIDTQTTDSNGEAVFRGLIEGNYYLYENIAPDQYIRLSSPIQITIQKDDEGNYVVTQTIENSKAPSTGGAGTMMYLIGGAVLIAAALFILLFRKKEKKEEANQE